MVAGLGNNPAVNLPIRTTIEAVMEGGKAVSVVIDSSRALTEAEQNEVIRKVQVLGKIYIIGVNTKSFEFTEQPDRVTFKREKITDLGQVKEKPAVAKSNFAELLTAKEQKLVAQQAPLIQKPEDQRTDVEREALNYISKRIEGVTEAKRVFVTQAPQPAPPQPAPRQPPPPPAPKFEYVAQGVGADKTAGFGQGRIKTSTYEFAYKISSKNKKITQTQFQEKAVALQPTMSLYAQFLERFPEAVVSNPKGRSADFRKFVSNELKRMDKQLQKAIVEPSDGSDLRALNDKLDFVEELKNKYNALPKPAGPSFKERLKALNPKSPARVFNDRFSLEVEFKLQRL